MATISSLGIGSGIDLESLVQGLVNAEKAPLTRLQNQVTSYNTKISALGTLSSKLSSLRTAAQALKPSALQTAMEKFATNSGKLADDKIGSVTAGAGALQGSYTLDVKNLASGQKIAFGSAPANIASGGMLTIDLGKVENGAFAADSSRQINVTVGAGDSLESVAAAINREKSGVTASVVNGKNGKELLISGEEGAENAFRISGLGLDYDPAAASGNYRKISDAANAEIEIDGIAITSKSNKVTDALPGVTLELKSAGQTTLSVTTNSTEKLQKSLEDFVKAFNDAVGTINSLGAYNAETKVAGALQGNSLLRETQSALRNLVFGTELNGTTLSSIGVSFKGTDGTLSLDMDKLKAAVEKDPETIAKFAAEVGARFDDKLNSLAGTGGQIQSSQDSMKLSVKSLEKQQDSLTLRLEQVEARYRKQFAALDTLLADLNSTSSRLAQSLAGLQTSYK
ncbi:MAG: flagellar filament capping protein FliD [Zoogloeaceae bacterium]|jgi:flagellar hook-associated protein 2|nr:flagellar filament capping protein FliD [Zoogloeaceae bacterium]